MLLCVTCPQYLMDYSLPADVGAANSYFYKHFKFAGFYSVSGLRILKHLEVAVKPGHF